MYNWWSLSTSYLLAIRVRVTVGDSGLCRSSLCDVFRALISSLVCWFSRAKRFRRIFRKTKLTKPRPLSWEGSRAWVLNCVFLRGLARLSVYKGQVGGACSSWLSTVLALTKRRVSLFTTTGNCNGTLLLSELRWLCKMYVTGRWDGMGCSNQSVNAFFMSLHSMVICSQQC